MKIYNLYLNGCLVDTVYSLSDAISRLQARGYNVRFVNDDLVCDMGDELVSVTVK